MAKSVAGDLAGWIDHPGDEFVCAGHNAHLFLGYGSGNHGEIWNFAATGVDVTSGCCLVVGGEDAADFHFARPG